jgi:hypothetical protein
MPQVSESTRSDLASRLAEAEESLATISGIVEEFWRIRSWMVPGPDRDRIDKSIRVNEETLASLQQSVAHYKEELQHA